MDQQLVHKEYKKATPAVPCRTPSAPVHTDLRASSGPPRAEPSAARHLHERALAAAPAPAPLPVLVRGWRGADDANHLSDTPARVTVGGRSQWDWLARHPPESQ